MIKPLPVNQGRKTEWVKSRLLSYIHDNDMKSGDKIPPVRELCEVLQVGSSSVFRCPKSRLVGICEAKNCRSARQAAGAPSLLTAGLWDLRKAREVR